MVVHVYIYNENREFLIQRRSRKKKVNSGKWDITGGAVKAGEESLSAVLRETKEEIGLELDPEKLRFAGRSISIKHLVDVYFVETQIDVDSLVLQEEEVSDVKMIPVEQLLESLKITEFQDSNYSAIVVNEINRLWNKTSSN